MIVDDFIDLDSWDTSSGSSSVAFNSLVRNAFCFLRRAIGEFDESPKYSVIHFCAAVELLVKARLMQEHWSLIVAKPELADKEKFKKGEFVSVSLVEAKKRLQNIADEAIPDTAMSRFTKLADHRNKSIHFYHDGMEKDEKEMAKIEAEQCLSWYHLQRLLQRWSKHFIEFGPEIADINSRMKLHKRYLSAKFTELKLELDEFRRIGMAPELCGVCGFDAAVPSEDGDEQINFVHCQVCDYADTQVTIPCPSCLVMVVIAREGFATCDSCDFEIRPEHLVDALMDLTTMHFAIKGGDNSWDIGNCGNCEGTQLVIRRGIGYFCTGCFELFNEVEGCEWCGEPNTGDMEDSYGIGCGQCEGQWGHVKDHS